jgi:N-methylhydantoinase B
MSDPITEELFRNAISAIGDEMVLTIYRTAYSGVLKNIMDYSAAICDAEGRLVAQGLSLPGHLCSIPVSLQAVLAHFGDDVHPGDIFINNDPYDGGMHLPDIFIFKPLIADGRPNTIRMLVGGCLARTPRTAWKSMPRVCGFRH